MFRRIRKILCWTISVIILLIIAIVVALYIPPVQNLIKNIALEQVKKSTGMDITVGHFRLKFPLSVSVSDVQIIEASGDTMLRAGEADVSVKFWPLLKGDIDVSGAKVEDVFYQLGNRDSSIWIRANVKDFDLDVALLNFGKGQIDLHKAVLDGGDVWLCIKDTVKEEKTDTTATSPLRITAGDIELNNLTYRMKMLPTIDSLYADIPEARLKNGTVDLGKQTISAALLSVDSITAAYFLPSEEFLETYHPIDTIVDPIEETPDSLLWNISVDKILLSGKSALYATKDEEPLPGLDFKFLQARDIDIEIDSFFNHGAEIIVPIKELKATERCGITLGVTGLFKIDSTAMRAEGMKINTDYSHIDFDASMGMGDPVKDPDLPLNLNAHGNISPLDLEMAFPTLNAVFAKGLPKSEIDLGADVRGSLNHIDIDELYLNYSPLLSLRAGGEISHPMEFERMDGNVWIKGSMHQLNEVKSLFLDKSMAAEINLPTLTLDGKVKFDPGLIAGNLKATADDGTIAASGSWRQKIEGYELDLTMSDMPIGKIMPSLGINTVSTSIKAKGAGFDFYSPKTYLDAEIALINADYLGYSYKDIDLTAHLKDGAFEAEVVSNNESAEFDIEVSGTISRSEVTWKLNGDIQTLNLKELGLSETENDGTVMIDTYGSIDMKARLADATLTVNDLDWNLDGKRLYTDRIDLNATASDSMLFATLRTGDLNVRLASLNPLDTILAKISTFGAVMDSTIARRSIDIPLIERSLPNIDIEVSAGSSNVVQDYLLQSDMGFRNAFFSFRNDSLLNFDAKVLGFTSKDMRIDTLSFGAVQHGKFLAFTGAMDNRPGTMDNFAHVKLSGYLSDDKMTLILRQRNIDDEQGFYLGLNLNVDGDEATLRLVPYTPTIGYKEWTLNKDNFIEYNFVNHHIDANLSLASAKSFIKIYTDHVEGEEGQEDVTVQLSEIQLADWLSISPFSPPIKGELGANLRIHWDQGVLTGAGYVSLDDLIYGKERVGDFNLGIDVSSKSTGALAANVSLMVDSVKVITAQGVLNDSTRTNPFDLDFSMIRFPLKVVNPFLPKEYAQLSGTLNGQMDVTGSLTSPLFNGFLDFDSTKVNIPMLGSSLTFSENKIPVDSNIVRFDNFAIKALNENPLTVNGTVDISSLSNVGINLGLNARDIQVVNSSRAKKNEDVYGKAFFNVDADVKGNMKLLRVNASLSVLAGTNVTYILRDAQAALSSQNTHDLVKFVNFADSAAVELADTIQQSMAMILNADLRVNQGSTINVDLSPDGKNKVTINGEGSLDYSMSPVNPGRLTGRFNINSGFVRYTPPLMSEKLFNFENGSYVAFNGDIMNPILNIHAVDHLKANVTQSGQDSRLIEFDVTLAITNTLANMNVAFGLSTNDDITVQNELSSMTPEQRATQAMNLLLYNTYTGPGTTGTSNLAGNPLYSFLASQLNSWAARNIRGVDISFGIDQYNKTTNGYTSTATSYSYKVSKSLFNDRFTIVVGGNYSTDSNADENLEQNLISDIAFEYKLNRSGSMYLKVFRHTGYESILEGEITETGVGFVIRRKIRSLKDLFRFRFPARRHYTTDGGVIVNEKTDSIKQPATDEAKK